MADSPAEGQDGSATVPAGRPSIATITTIGTLNEGSLHAFLKRHYAAPGDAFEVSRQGFVVDLVKAPGTDHELLVEIQTGSFAALGKKLDHLLSDHRILLVHPVAVRTMLDRLDRPPRRSPKRGSIYSVLDELVSIPTLLDHPHLSLDVVLIHETRKQIHDPGLRRRRGGYRTVDRHVDEIVGQHRFDSPTDLARLLPPDLAPEFTTADMASAAECSRDAAQKLAFCLRAVGLVEETRRSRAGYHYRLTAARGS